MATPRWAINGVILPRNPTSFALTHDNSNATYVKMADGSQRRMTPPNMLTAAKVQMEWMYADSRVQNLILSKINQALMAASSSAAISKILLDGELPAVEVWAYIESPSVTYSGHAINGGGGGAAGSSPDLVVDTRIGQGGVRKDLVIEGRTDGPYLHSHNPVPATLPTQASVSAWYGGPTGNNSVDGLPTWNGLAWNQTCSTSATLSFSNLGTAPWSPMIRLNGPFNNGLTLTAAYQDVDGTGRGVIFAYTGPNVHAGDFLTLDTAKMRLMQSVASVTTEIYTFSLQTVGTSTPFPYWPPAPPGTFLIGVTLSGGTASTSVDYSNAGSESFRYWA